MKKLLEENETLTQIVNCAGRHWPPTTPNHQTTHLPGRVSPIYKPKQSDSRDLFIIEHEIEVLLLIYCADEQTTT